jgi:hypothetical protein
VFGESVDPGSPPYAVLGMVKQFCKGAMGNQSKQRASENRVLFVHHKVSEFRDRAMHCNIALVSGFSVLEWVTDARGFGIVVLGSFRVAIGCSAGGYSVYCWYASKKGAERQGCGRGSEAVANNLRCFLRRMTAASSGGSLATTPISFPVMRVRQKLLNWVMRGAASV